MTPEPDAQAIFLCRSQDLSDGGLAVPFDVRYGGQSCYAFAIRYRGTVYAYLNRCSHVPMEMDYQPNRFFDSTGHWLVCATHGAMYSPTDGSCLAGPCRGRLIAIAVTENDGLIHWHTAYNLKPLEI